jgi:hypothetical protein
VQLKAAYPDVFKDRSLAPPPKHALAALGGQAQQKELLDRCAEVSLCVHVTGYGVVLCVCVYHFINCGVG